MAGKKVIAKEIKFNDRTYWMRCKRNFCAPKSIKEYLKACPTMKIPDNLKMDKIIGGLGMFSPIAPYEIEYSSLPTFISRGQTRPRVQKNIIENDKTTIATNVPVFSEELKVIKFIDVLRCDASGNVEIAQYMPANPISELRLLRMLFNERISLEDTKNLELSYFDAERHWRIGF